MKIIILTTEPPLFFEIARSYTLKTVRILQFFLKASQQVHHPL